MKTKEGPGDTGGREIRVFLPPERFLPKFPHELSGGQRQRVAIARALAAGPEALLADEPVSMLDVSIRLGVLNLLADLQREEGLGVLYITHDLATARHFSDEIMVLNQGRVVEHGPRGASSRTRRRVVERDEDETRRRQTLSRTRGR